MLLIQDGLMGQYGGSSVYTMTNGSLMSVKRQDVQGGDFSYNARSMSRASGSVAAYQQQQVIIGGSPKEQLLLNNILAISRNSNSIVSKNSKNHKRQISLICSSPGRRSPVALTRNLSSNNAFSNEANRGTDREENKSIVISSRNRVGS